MTNVIKRSNLVLPSSGYELDREEMCYVDGGIYISHGTIQSFVRAFGRAGANVPAAAIGFASAMFGSLKAALAAGVTAFFSWINALPVVGQILFCYLAANALVVAGYFATAYVQGKGVDLSVGWSWFVPYVKSTIY